MKFCQHCGKELPDDALICVGCGRIVIAPKPVEPIVAAQEEPAAVEEQAAEVKEPKAQTSARTKDITWIIRLFSIILCMVACVLYAASRNIKIIVSYGANFYAYTSCDEALILSAVAMLAAATLLTIADISLVGVAVSKHKAESSKLLSPIVLLMLILTLILVFMLMG